MSYAHSGEDLDRLAKVYDEVFGLIAEGLTRGIRTVLECAVLEPLFKIR